MTLNTFWTHVTHFGHITQAHTFFKSSSETTRKNELKYCKQILAKLQMMLDFTVQRKNDQTGQI